MEVFESVMEELHRRHAYKCEVYAPFYICSAMTHAFNMVNQKKEIYWEGSRLPNMRLHILFVAPSGYMKTFYIGNMAGDRYGIFQNAGIHVGHEQSLTEAGFVGTLRNIGGVDDIKIEGAAQTYSNGIMCIDEFSAITNALKVNYNAQFDTQLLAALDHGSVYKRLGGGKIDYQTNLTLWAGVQPARYDLASGMGRRMCFLVFLPTKYDNQQLRISMNKARGVRPDHTGMLRMWARIEKLIKLMEGVKSITFDESVAKMYDDLDLPSFEGTFFDRLLLGYHLSEYGPEENITLTIDGKGITQLVNYQKTWRDDIKKGIDYIQMLKLIKSAGIKTEEGIETSTAELVETSIMVGWNAHQIHEKLIEMARMHMIILKGARVILPVVEDEEG
jgi:hypothetical protein